MKEELYNLLKEWFVCEWDCEDCQHMATYRDNDNRHPCAKCNSNENFKIAAHVDADLKDKVKEIMNIVRKGKI